MAKARRVRVFLNNRSGIGSVSPEILCNMFATHGLACEVTILERHIDLPALAAYDPEDLAWIAAGGDGTVNAVAHAIAGTSRPMGVLPVGTLNHFAQDLGLPRTLASAIEVIATGDIQIVDAAEVNGITFVNNSSLGVYPAMVLDRERMKKSGWNKWWSLVIASARAFIRFRCLQVELELHGGIRRCTTPLLFVGNNLYAIDGGRLGRRERLDEGCLSLFLVPHTTRMAMLRLLIAALFGRVRGARELEEFTVKSVTVRAHRRRLRVSYDGEVKRMPPPLHYASRHGALRVIVSAKETR
jgi:diacylglycerol kinase family enzyme